MIAKIAAIAEKKDWLQFYLSNRGDLSDHMETTLQRSQRLQRQQKYQHALHTLTLFKIAANTNIEKAIDFLWRKYKNTTVFTTNFQRNIEKSRRKSTGRKAIGEKFDLSAEHEFSVLPVASSSTSKNTRNYKKTRLK